MLIRNVRIRLLQDYRCHNPQYKNKLNILYAGVAVLSLRNIVVWDITSRLLSRWNFLVLFYPEDGGRMFLRNVC
jgi:hypothetical protein